MALLLLEERRRGRDSPVWGYVEHLPLQFDTLLHWSEAELRELCYPALQQLVSGCDAVQIHQGRLVASSCMDGCGGVCTWQAAYLAGCLVSCASRQSGARCELPMQQCACVGRALTRA